MEVRLGILEAKLAELLVTQAEGRARDAELKAGLAELKALWFRAELQRGSR